MAKVEKEVKKQKAFDPTKQYAWKPDDEFVIDGLQFQQLYNTLMAKAQDPEWIQTVNEYESLKVLQEIFSRGVEQGVIVDKADFDIQKDENQNPEK